MRFFGRYVHVSLWQASAGILILVGVAFAVLAIGAQSDIEEIGDTNDEVLLNRVASLQDDRDAFVVCAVGFSFLGLFGLFTLSERGHPSRFAEDQMESGTRAVQSLIRGLMLSGNASYLPASHGLTEERLFVPAAVGAIKPPGALSDDMAVVPGNGGSPPGMLMEPPGLRLLETIENDYGSAIAGMGIENAEGSLQVLKHSLDVLKDFHFKERDGATLLRVEYGDLVRACRSVRQDVPDACRQAACIGCSCLLVAAARATGKVVQVEEVDNSSDTVVFKLRLADW